MIGGGDHRLPMSAVTKAKQKRSGSDLTSLSSSQSIYGARKPPVPRGPTSQPALRARHRSKEVRSGGESSRQLPRRGRMPEAGLIDDLQQHGTRPDARRPAKKRPDALGALLGTKQVLKAVSSSLEGRAPSGGQLGLQTDGRQGLKERYTRHAAPAAKDPGEQRDLRSGSSFRKKRGSPSTRR